MSIEDRMAELKAREDKAKAMGGPERLARRDAQGLLNARSRIDAY